MAETTETLDSPNEELDGQAEPEEVVVDENDDADVLKEKLEKIQENNKKLFARTKKAEGFVLDDGKWIKKPVEKKEVVEEKKPETPSGITEERVGQIMGEQLETRDLNDLDVSDDLRTDIKDYAKLKGISVKKALDSDYIKFRKTEEEKSATEDEASLGGGKRTTATKDPSKIEVNTLDTRKEEDQKEFEKWEEAKRKELG